MQIYRFRNCLLNTSERTVIKDDDCLELTTRTFDVLQYLIENAGKVLTKDEILGNVWEGSFVEESNLPVHISKLRKVLGDSRESRFIETVQGSGYRFVAPISLVSENEWSRVVSRGRPLEAEVSNSRDSEVRSIAVLPLRNESSDPDLDYVVDGLTENIINDLSRVHGLRVLARDTVFGYPRTDVDVGKISRQLGVSRILMGRVRVVGDNLIVGVELVNADQGIQVWGGKFVRTLSGLLAVQEEISLSVVENLVSATVRKKAYLVTSLSREPESYRLYLKGRHLLEKHSGEDIHKAIECFRESLALDPANLHSYAEIVECYRTLYTYDKISYGEFLCFTRPILSGVFQGNEDSDVVQVMHCDLSMLEWNFDKATIHCRKALTINPNSLKGRLRYSDILLQSRNFHAAMEQLEKLLIIDPLSALIYKRLGRLFYFMGEYKTAIAYLDDALELEPDSHEALALKGAIHSETGGFKEALACFDQSLSSEYQVEMVAMIAVLQARMGDYDKANELLEQVLAESTKLTRHFVMLAHIYLALGKKNEAYNALDMAYTQHEPDLRALTYDRRWSPIRSETRFKELIARVGLPNVQG